jgi:hypothetical protein
MQELREILQRQAEHFESIGKHWLDQAEHLAKAKAFARQKSDEAYLLYHRTKMLIEAMDDHPNVPRPCIAKDALPEVNGESMYLSDEPPSENPLDKDGLSG